MNALGDKRKAYKILAWIFAIGGLVWMINGFFSQRYLFYPFLGLVNWALAWLCFQASQ